SSFFKLSMKRTTFTDSLLHEVDFSGTDLTESHFNACDLHMATFDQTNLEKVDFRTASRFQVDPETNKLKKAKFAKENLTGLVEHLDISIS
ncbi:MAG: pentapeptide repeat-containing protein, partial [Bacteroidota bacterium]